MVIQIQCVSKVFLKLISVEYFSCAWIEDELRSWQRKTFLKNVNKHASNFASYVASSWNFAVFSVQMRNMYSTAGHSQQSHLLLVGHSLQSRKQQLFAWLAKTCHAIKFKWKQFDENQHGSLHDNDASVFIILSPEAHRHWEMCKSNRLTLTTKCCMFQQTVNNIHDRAHTQYTMHTQRGELASKQYCTFQPCKGCTKKQVMRT